LNFYLLIIIAVGLSMDAVAVSISSGMRLNTIRFRDAAKIALFFGVFQAVMPVIGWYAGSHIVRFISYYDHWIAFGLLAFVGFKMIWESFRADGQKSNVNPLDLKVLLLLAIATSIDALAVGLGFAILNVNIVSAISIIGIITFVLSLIAVYVGKFCSCRFGKRVELLGGLILIGIGLKILIQHLLAQ